MGGLMVGRLVALMVASSRGVAERWKNQYHDGTKWRTTATGDAGATYERIVAAGIDPDAVATAIGNKSWTHPSCKNCGEDFERLAAFGQYDRDIYLCLPCLEEGRRILAS